MRNGRELLDHWLFQVKLSGIIPKGGEILEIGSGQCWEHYAMFHDMYQFQPSDHIIYEDMPNEVSLDATNFAASEYIKARDNMPFEAILASQILEHCPRPDLVLAQCYMYLKEKGYLIVTLPFWYRIHESAEYQPDDHETSEIKMRDYWRICPAGLEYLFYEAGFQKFHVTALSPDDAHKFVPPFVVGWAQRDTSIPLDVRPLYVQEWSYDIPENWRMQQMRLEADFKRNILDRK